jgi:hypothetical protein
MFCFCQVFFIIILHPLHLQNGSADSGLKITRIASQFAMQYMSVAMQLRFCIAVGCDAKTTAVLLIYYYYLSRVTIL